MESSLGSQPDDGKKVINVSIEMIRDPLDRSRVDESNYIDSNQNLHWVPDMTDRGEISERPKHFSGGSGGGEKTEKYKKMKDKYK
jgi:hypothetical protein